MIIFSYIDANVNKATVTLIPLKNVFTRLWQGFYEEEIAFLVIPTCKRNCLKGEVVIVVAVDTPKRAHKHNAEKKKTATRVW